MRQLPEKCNRGCLILLLPTPLASADPRFSVPFMRAQGFMHQPQFFLSQMIYGESFETVGHLRSAWSAQTDGGAAGSITLDNSHPFGASRRASMRVDFPSGTGAVRLANRGMGNEGLVFQAGKPYEGYFWARSDAAATVTVALNDYVGGVVLASTTVTVSAGAAWSQHSFTLTPSSNTSCVGITSDPNISCNNAFADYICIKCGGEVSFGLSAPGTMWVGYARLEPGAWGRWAGLPIRAEAQQILSDMGVTALRYGGAVGTSVQWEDFRGPVWNRTSLGRTWGAVDMSGWGPFDAMDAFASMNISVFVGLSASATPAYLANLVEYCLGDASTTWGALRIADGHPTLYKPAAWEIGNGEVRKEGGDLEFFFLSGSTFELVRSTTRLKPDPHTYPLSTPTSYHPQRHTTTILWHRCRLWRPKPPRWGTLTRYVVAQLRATCGW